MHLEHLWKKFSNYYYSIDHCGYILLSYKFIYLFIALNLLPSRINAMKRKVRRKRLLQKKIYPLYAEKPPSQGAHIAVKSHNSGDHPPRIPSHKPLLFILSILSLVSKWLPFRAFFFFFTSGNGKMSVGPGRDYREVGKPL